MPIIDPSTPAPWRASQRRSDARRGAEAARRVRRLRGRRGALAAGLAALALAGSAEGSIPTAKGKPRAVQGAPVAVVQRALGIPADGIVGPQTRRAIRRFQRSHGLAVDGVVGPQTLAALGLGTARSATVAGSPVLATIAMCESGGNPAAVSADGRYRGKYQFSRATWRDMGGKGDPAAAPEAEQDRRAARLLAEAGTSPWPNCA